MAGSTTVLPIAEAIAQAYSEENPGVTVSVAGGGSTRGIQALLEQTVNIASSSRFLTKREVEQALERGTYLVPFRIAYDCILPVVHVGNRLTDVTTRELKLVFSGEITNWKQIGGSDLTIKVISRDEKSGTRKVWDQLVMQEEPLSSTALLRRSTAAVLTAVSQQRGAIGYIGLGHLNASVKPLAVSGTMGSLQTARDGTYSLGRPLFMFTRGWPDGTALAFINFVLHPRQGQRLVYETGYVPLY